MPTFLLTVMVLAAAPTESLTLARALELGRAQNHALARARLDVTGAREQVDEAWSSVWPRADVTLRYTRTLEQPDPFAGSDAGDLFDQFGSSGGGGDDPFLIANRYDLTLGVTQALYNRAAFAAIRGAESYESQALAARDDAWRRTALQIAQAFHGALLAGAQVDVLQRSVTRTEDSVNDTARRVEQGVTPRFQQLSAEVELANLRTQLLGAQATADAALDGLKRLIGMPVERPVSLGGALVLKRRRTAVGFDDAMATAAERRPDLVAAALTVGLSDVRVEIAEAAHWPVLSAFLNAGYVGTGNEDIVWGANVTAGLQLVGTLFDGFGTTSRVDRDRLEASRARSIHTELRAAVALEVRDALRRLDTAQARIRTQERNVERAATNYEHAKARVDEGVSTQLELRNANQQLDQSRLHHLQAVHDYLVAWIALEVATGAAPEDLVGVGQ